jgi:hypothetical protein
MRHVPRAALLAAFLSLNFAPSAGAAKFSYFHTPSDNIGCAMYDKGEQGIFVRCDIGEHAWSLPPRPHTKACRELDYISGLVLGPKGKSHFFCAGDTAMHQGSVLAYGDSRRVGRFTCTSRTSGVTCRNRRNGHGLFLSRASYRRF